MLARMGNMNTQRSRLGRYLDAKDAVAVPDETLRLLARNAIQMETMYCPTPEHPTGKLPEDVMKSLAWVDWLVEAVIELRAQVPK